MSNSHGAMFNLDLRTNLFQQRNNDMRISSSILSTFILSALFMAQDLHGENGVQKGLKTKMHFQN